MKNLYSPLDQFYVLPLEHASKIVDFSFFFANNTFLTDISVEYRWLGFIIGAFVYGLTDKQIYLHFPYIWLTDNISFSFLQNNILEGASNSTIQQLINMSKQQYAHFLNRDIVFNYMNYSDKSIFENCDMEHLLSKSGLIGFLGIWVNFVENSGDLVNLYRHCLNYPTYLGAYSAAPFPKDFLFDAFGEILSNNDGLGMLYLNNIQTRFLNNQVDKGFEEAEVLLNRWEEDVKTGMLKTYQMILDYFSVEGQQTLDHLQSAMDYAQAETNQKFSAHDIQIIRNFYHTIPGDDFYQIVRLMFAHAHVYLTGFFLKSVTLAERTLDLSKAVDRVCENCSEEDANHLTDFLIRKLDINWFNMFFYQIPRSYNLQVPFESLYHNDTVEITNPDNVRRYFFSNAYSFANDFHGYFEFLTYASNAIKNKLVMDPTVSSFSAVNVSNDRGALLILLAHNLLTYANEYINVTNLGSYSSTGFATLTTSNPYVGNLFANFELFFFNSTLGLFSVTSMIFLGFILYNVIFVDVRHTNNRVIKDEYVKDTTYAQFIIPNYTRYIAEQLYRLLLTITLGNIVDKNAKYFFPTIFVTFHIVLFFNLYGMLPLSFTFTSLFVITFTMSLWLFVGLNIIGLAKNKTSFFGLFIPSNVPTVLIPFLVVLETISYFFRVISVSVRLFANMMAGHTLLKVLSTFVMGAVMNTAKMSPVIAIIPLVLGTGLLVIIIGLEVAVAFIQAYVFTVLFSVYINDALQGGH